MESKEKVITKKEECATLNEGIDVEAKGTKARLEKATVSRQNNIKDQESKNNNPIKIGVGVLALVVILIGVFILSNTNSAQGVWELYSIEQGGNIIEGEDLEVQYGGKVLYNLNHDGTLIVEMLGQELEGIWSEEELNVQFYYSSSLKELERDGDTMLLEQNGATYTLIR